MSEDGAGASIVRTSVKPASMISGGANPNIVWASRSAVTGSDKLIPLFRGDARSLAPNNRVASAFDRVLDCAIKFQRRFQNQGGLRDLA